MVELVKGKSTPVLRLIADAFDLRIEGYKTLALSKIEKDQNVYAAIKNLVPDPFALKF